MTQATDLAAVRLATQGLGRASRRHAVLAQALSAAGEKMEAAQVLHRAFQLGGGQAPDYEALGFAAFGLNEHELSRAFYAEVVQLAPGDALARYNLASSERNLGRLAEAQAQCEAALDLDPQQFQVALLRAQLRTQTPQANHVDALRSSLMQHGGAVAAQIFLNYALGKELDDLGAYDEAFAHFSAGARARRRSLDYSVDRDIEVLARIQDVYPNWANRSGDGQSAQYGFILGLPRSGTTLIERVLTGHASVRSNGETDNVWAALSQSLPGGPGDIFARAALADPQAVAAGYRRLAGAAPAGGRVLEKLPLNYLYLGAIRNALPDAPIVLVRRNPLDNCFGMFSTLFGSAYPFSYDLTELGRYYVAYDRLARHWLARFGERILETPYESFVREPETWGARLAAFAGVPWDAGLLDIQRNRTPSATASAVQIRQPIYSSAIGRWRHYAKHLEPLLATLEAHGLRATDES
jgi:tetratricopeptide (TPR) repeat protein